MIHSIRWRIAIPFIALILVVIGGLSAYLLEHFRQTYLANLQGRLQVEAALVGELAVAQLSEPPVDPALGALAADYAEQLGARITIVDPQGLVLADSEADPAQMDNHRYRPEIRDAFNDGEGSAIRLSATLNREMMYVAHRVRRDGGPGPRSVYR